MNATKKTNQTKKNSILRSGWKGWAVFFLLTPWAVEKQKHHFLIYSDDAVVY